MDTAVQGIEDLTGFALQVIQETGKAALSYYGKAKPGERFDEELVIKAELHLTSFSRTASATVFPSTSCMQTTWRIWGTPMKTNGIYGFSIRWTVWPIFRGVSRCGECPWHSWRIHGLFSALFICPQRETYSMPVPGRRHTGVNRKFMRHPLPKSMTKVFC